MANTSERIYEDFAPVSDFISEKECDTLLLYLPGFRKEQLKVQLTTSRVLRVSGERAIGDNKWKRFHKEFPVPSNINTKEMTAKFEGGILYIRQPKLIIPEATEQQQEEKTAQDAPQAQQQEQPPAPQPQQESHPEEKMEKEDEDIEKKNEKVGGTSEVFKELRKPEKLKKLAVYGILLLILVFNIAKMFKSFSKVEQQSVMKYDHQEL